VSGLLCGSLPVARFGASFAWRPAKTALVVSAELRLVREPNLLSDGRK